MEIGVETTDRLAIKPAQMYIDRTARHKFVLKSSLQIEDPDKQAFVIAPMHAMIIPKGMASESLLVDILINKFFYHLPYYRQIQKYKELGVVLSDATINDWFAAVCSKLRPLYDKQREVIMEKDYIQVDESTLPVIDNEKHRAVKGYMWAGRTISSAVITMPQCVQQSYTHSSPAARLTMSISGNGWKIRSGVFL